MLILPLYRSCNDICYYISTAMTHSGSDHDGQNLFDIMKQNSMVKGSERLAVTWNQTLLGPPLLGSTTKL